MNFQQTLIAILLFSGQAFGETTCKIDGLAKVGEDQSDVASGECINFGYTAAKKQNEEKVIGSTSTISLDYTNSNEVEEFKINGAISVTKK